MKFKGWIKVIIREECEVEADSYTQALLLTRGESQVTKEFYDSSDNVAGVEYGVTPQSMKEKTEEVEDDKGC